MSQPQLRSTPNNRRGGLTPSGRTNRNITQASFASSPDTTPTPRRTVFPIYSNDSPITFDFSQATLGRSQESQSRVSTAPQNHRRERSHSTERERRAGREPPSSGDRSRDRDPVPLNSREREGRGAREQERWVAPRPVDRRENPLPRSNRDRVQGSGDEVFNDQFGNGVEFASLLRSQPRDRQPSVVEEEDAEDNADEDEEHHMVELKVRIPTSISTEEVSDILNTALYNRRHKRSYDSTHLSGEFEDGGQTWNALIFACRVEFARFLSWSDSAIPGFIDSALGKRADRFSNAYKKAYSRVQEWRKNWFFNYANEVDLLQTELENEHVGLARLHESDLREAYGKLFKYQLLYRLMGTTTAIINWAKVLDNPNAFQLYKTIWTYSLIYSHTYRHWPAKLSKADGRERIRLIARHKGFQRFTTSILVLLPQKPQTKVRASKRDRPTNIDALDPSFEIFQDEGEEEGDGTVNTGNATPVEEAAAPRRQRNRDRQVASASVPAPVSPPAPVEHISSDLSEPENEEGGEYPVTEDEAEPESSMPLSQVDGADLFDDE